MQSDRPKLEDLRGNLNIGMTLQSARNIAKLGSKMLSSPVSDVFFEFQIRNLRIDIDDFAYRQLSSTKYVFWLK